MRCKIIQPVVLFVLVCVLAIYGACAAQRPCMISPVEIEEIKSDIRDLDQKLAERKELLVKLEAEITEMQARIEDRRGKLSLVQTELARLKKASGMTEKSAEETAPIQPVVDTGVETR